MEKAKVGQRFTSATWAGGVKETLQRHLSLSLSLRSNSAFLFVLLLLLPLHLLRAFVSSLSFVWLLQQYSVRQGLKKIHRRLKAQRENDEINSQIQSLSTWYVF